MEHRKYCGGNKRTRVPEGICMNAGRKRACIHASEGWVDRASTQRRQQKVGDDSLFCAAAVPALFFLLPSGSSGIWKLRFAVATSGGLARYLISSHPSFSILLLYLAPLGSLIPPSPALSLSFLLVSLCAICSSVHLFTLFFLS
ncbi:hypothetical protein OPV22_002042 [Ensete ventricosum]|uniref:Transmembrane protein n=1 Tax=Ensete ventricosum TaxID=4639 RepID=A0AAV8RWS9_ENSVE|nr:hypothetical protein OPV22_002042 [Ensete ventricosum]